MSIASVINRIGMLFPSRTISKEVEKKLIRKEEQRLQAKLGLELSGEAPDFDAEETLFDDLEPEEQTWFELHKQAEANVKKALVAANITVESDDETDEAEETEESAVGDETEITDEEIIEEIKAEEETEETDEASDVEDTEETDETDETEEVDEADETEETDEAEETETAEEADEVEDTTEEVDETEEAEETDEADETEEVSDVDETEETEDTTEETEEETDVDTTEETEEETETVAEDTEETDDTSEPAQMYGDELSADTIEDVTAQIPEVSELEDYSEVLPQPQDTLEDEIGGNEITDESEEDVAVIPAKDEEEDPLVDEDTMSDDIEIGEDDFEGSSGGKTEPAVTEEDKTEPAKGEIDDAPEVDDGFRLPWMNPIKDEEDNEDKPSDRHDNDVPPSIPSDDPFGDDYPTPPRDNNEDDKVKTQADAYEDPAAKYKELDDKRANGGLTEEEERLYHELESRISAQDKIDNDCTIDGEMADALVTNGMPEEVTSVDSEELVGATVQEAITVLADAYHVQVFNNTVYTTNISKNTDSVSISENRKMANDFLASYNEALDMANSSDMEFLTIADETSFNSVQKIAGRLGDNKYVLSKELSSAKDRVEAIQFKEVDKKDKNEKLYNQLGMSILHKLQEKITEDNTIEDNKEDEILTENEYFEIEDAFNLADDKSLAYDKLVEDAKKYGVFKMKSVA